eukprot:GFUD01098924.1.p1 GENE.GFUD01098924.1~~GFUD01098924.1.p1  ORF type:complete len:425 (+),score=145.87 GFUD01098924.1:58-1332(+)
MYVELDHGLIPGKIEDINVLHELSGEKKNNPREMNLNKYEIQKGNIQDLFQIIKKERVVNTEDSDRLRKEEEEDSRRNLFRKKEKGNDTKKDKGNDTKKVAEVEYEAVAGTSCEDLFYDKDWGFFAALLACYNNHWVLRTSPDDWWNIIVRNVAQMVDKNGEKNKVRDFFVDHEEKKTILVLLPGRLDNMDHSWLFDQFSQGIKENIKTPGYVDSMQADFSTTTADQLISTQIMLMSSLQKYFDFDCSTKCGIPGVEMTGTLEDWLKLADKTENLKKMLQPILEEIGLEKWFTTTLDMLGRLVDTYKGSPDKEWWGHILSWNITHGSGARSWWTGWMIDFLMAGRAEKPQDFQSGVVSVPLRIIDSVFGPPVDDVGELVAGTVGYSVEEGREGRAPVVEAKQGWVLLLPKGSPVIARIRGEDLY